MLLRAPILALLSACAAFPAQSDHGRAPSRTQSLPHPLRPTNGVSRNLTHMSPLLTYTGDVDYVFTPPRTPDGSMSDDISGSHHVLRSGASVSFNHSGSVFVVNGWAGDGAVVRVREEPLDDDDEKGWQRSPERGAASWWNLGSEVRAADAVSERTLVAMFGDGDDGARRVRMDVTAGEVWVSRVITKTDIPPSDEWGAPHWPIIEGWRGVHEYMGAEVRGTWRETYVDFNDIGIEQPVAWAFGASDNDDYASVTLWPAPGATYLELRGATPLPSSGSGRYRVRIDPPVPGHEDAWHTVDAAGNTPADIVLFSAAIEPSLAYKVTLDARGVGWHWANAWFLAEMGVRPLPRWIGHWGRVRRVFDAFRERLVFVIAGVAAVSAVVLGFVIARRRVIKVRDEDEERQPLLADDVEASTA